MKRRVTAMLAALMLLAGTILPGVGVYAEEELEMTVSTNGTVLNKGDGDGILDEMTSDNASILGSLGKTDWAALAASVVKSGKWRDDLVAVAQTQIGYKAGSDGNTIYTEWAEAEADGELPEDDYPDEEEPPEAGEKPLTGFRKFMRLFLVPEDEIETFDPVPKTPPAVPEVATQENGTDTLTSLVEAFLLGDDAPIRAAQVAGMPLPLAAERVNEEFLALIGDVLLLPSDHGFTLIEDYREDAEQWLKTHKK